MQLGDLVVSASSGFHRLNQDSHGCWSEQGYSGLAIADGISETGERSALASAAAVREFLARTRVGLRAGGDGEGVCAAAVGALPRAVADALGQHSDQPTSNDAATTFIGCVASPNALVLSYVGDGQVLLTNGLLAYGRNLLLPHYDEFGRLTRYVGARTRPIPNLAKLHRNQLEGDLVALGSDGAILEGPDARRLMEAVRGCCISASTGDKNNLLADLTTILERHCVESRNRTADDASIALFVSADALSYWVSRQHLLSAGTAEPQAARRWNPSIDEPFE